MENKVQLKEQEIVGQEVVLSDIYPKTDTTSVQDPVSGSSLELKLDRIVEMINDKLTRVVNSVNARTGVVTLDADDVGLGNVDNVSFNDIQEWVISTLEQYFGDKRFRIYDTAAMLENTWHTNDEKLKNVPFYVQEWDPNNDDYRSAIGIFLYDETAKLLYYDYRFLNTIKYVTPYVLQYDKGKLNFVLDKPLPETTAIDKCGLQINPPSSIKTGGLSIDFDEVVGNIRSGYTLYVNKNDGETDVSDINFQTGFIIYKTDESDEIEEHGVKKNRYSLKINNVDYTRTTGTTNTSVIYSIDYGDQDLLDNVHQGDILVIDSLSEKNYEVNPDLKDHTKTSPFLKYHQPMIGRLHHNSNNVGDQSSTGGGTSRGTFNFHTLTPYVTWGLTNHQNFVKKSVLSGKDIISGNTETQIATIGPYSGINILSHPNQMDLTEWKDDETTYTEHDPSILLNKTVTPIGSVSIFTQTAEGKQNRQGGLFIPVDGSLMTYSYADYGKQITSISDDTGTRSKKATNWYAETPYHITEDTVNNHNGFLNTPTFVGINLMKAIEFENGSDEESHTPSLDSNNPDVATFVPLSGLRVVNPSTDSISWDLLGMTDSDSTRFADAEFMPTQFEYASGGLMINVGKGLEISPVGYPKDGNAYADYGKVTVRLGDGLKFDNDNRIIPDPDKIMMNGGASGLLGIQIIDPHRKNNTSLDYKLYPSTTNPRRVEGYHRITLGDGLRLQIDDNDIADIILMQLTIVKISYLQNQSFPSQGDPQFTPRDYIHPSHTYRYIKETGIPAFIAKLKEFNCMEYAYNVLRGLRDAEKMTMLMEYNESKVSQSMTINRLFLDEKYYGKTKDVNVIETMTIETLMENYSTRHHIEIGDYTRYDSGDIEEPDYSDEWTWFDYKGSEKYAHFFEVNPITVEPDSQGTPFTAAESNFLNTLLNIISALRASLNDVWDGLDSKTSLTESDTKDDTTVHTLTYRTTDDSVGGTTPHTISYKMSSIGIISCIIQALGNYNIPDNFLPSNIVAKKDPSRILDGNGKASEDFVYSQEQPVLSELTYANIMIGKNHAWIYGYKDKSLASWKVRGIKLLTIGDLKELVSNVNDVIVNPSKYESATSVHEHIFGNDMGFALSSDQLTEAGTRNETNTCDEMLMRIAYVGSGG